MRSDVKIPAGYGELPYQTGAGESNRLSWKDQRLSAVCERDVAEQSLVLAGL